MQDSQVRLDPGGSSDMSETQASHLSGSVCSPPCVRSILGLALPWWLQPKRGQQLHLPHRQVKSWLKYSLAQISLSLWSEGWNLLIGFSQDLPPELRES